MPAYDLTKEQSVDLIVQAALEYGITDKRQIAYMLASAQHESDDFRTSREYGGPRQARLRGYSGGEDYYGRGYVQVTHDYNYARMDRVLGLEGKLIADPDLVANDAQLGAQTLVVGMARGLYTGAALHRYVGGDMADYENARRTVNGTDKAEMIAGYARNWESQVPSIVERISLQGITYRPLPGSSILNDGEFRVGERGIEVQYAQVALDRLGYRDEQGNRLTTDGDFGSRTEQVVRAYQKDRGLPVTGAVDQQTLRTLGLHQYLKVQDPVHNLEQTTRGILPENLRAPQMIDGAPDYLVPGRNTPEPPRTPPIAQATPPAAATPAQPTPLRAGPIPTPQRTAIPSPPTEPAAPRPLSTTETLQPGDRGAAVQALQQHLQLIGVRNAAGREVKDDRDYGDRTREAVENFQLWSGREVTGIADPGTLQALQTHAQFVARQRAQGIAPGPHLSDNLQPSTPNLADAADLRTPRERNAIQNPAAFEQGQTLAAMQQGLIQLRYHHRTTQPLAVNGVNDEATRQAITAFQAQNNLPLSGNADQVTQQVLQQALLAQQQAAEQRQAEDKAREREKSQEQEQARAKELLPYSDPNSPQHALRNDFAERANAAGANLTEAQLTRAVALLQTHNIQLDQPGGVVLRDDTLYVRQFMPPSQFSLDTRQPAPPVHETVQETARSQERFAAEIQAMENAPKIQGPTLGGPGGPGGMPPMQG